MPISRCNGPVLNGPAEERPPQFTVLVVDDEPDIIYIVRRALRGEGFDVLDAPDVAGARALLRAKHVDIILCDIMMPRVSGLEFCKAVKRNPRFRDIYFILLTARDSLSDRVAGLDIGADDYITKPFDITELVARVRAGGRIALIQSRLRKESLTDSLTGFYTRKALWPFLDKEIARARRYSYSLSLLLLDIDNFKAINDTFGHLAGDEVLRQFGKLMQARLRESDIAVRFGGEEFAFVLPQTDMPGAENLARWICKAVRERQFEHEKHVLRLTASIGVTCLDACLEAGGQTLFRRADAAMYRAKQAGKDCVFVDTGQDPPKPSTPVDKEDA
ncbi:MAG: diguanylate cyclase [Planctomycetia bacterium]|nr:diguanylate cyclase [Planctomycetia bacterium]